MRQEPLERLVDGTRIWRAGDPAPPAEAGIPTGYPVLDACFPGGGWPAAALTEILSAHDGIGALRLLMPALACLSKGDRWIACIAPPHVPYAPALARHGVEVSRILVVHDRPGRDMFWAIEQGLRSGACSAVLAWLPSLESRAARRLQLAAEAGCSVGILFRPPRAAEESSPAALRLLIAPAGRGLTVQILKRRGGWPMRPLRVDECGPIPAPLRDRAPA